MQEVNLNKSVLNKLKEWRGSCLQFVKECIKVTPTEQQIELLVSVTKNKRITIRSGHGCHAAGTLVHMYPYGFKRVEDVEVGDQLMGDDSTPRNVLRLCRGREKMARIKYKNGTYYDVNMSHKLALVCTGSKSEFSSGDKIVISVRDYLKMIADRPSLASRFGCYKVAVRYQEIPVIIPPYILGLWLGDGSHKDLTLTNTDKTVIGIWQAFGEANGLQMTSTNDTQHRLTGDPDSIVHKAFEYYNLFGNKHIPKEYLFNSYEVRLKLLAGLIDTDGYINTRNNSVQCQIIQKRKELAEDILFLAQSCGMHASLVEKVKSWTYNREKKYDVYYEVSISRNADIIPTQISRKQGATKNRQRGNLHFGFSVEELPEDNYYGFELDGNNLYVLGDFTVTHNTGKSSAVSWVILWFMVTRPFAKVVCTAPTNRQLHDVLMTEISKWLRQSIVADEFVIRKDAIQHRDATKEWWIRFISPSVKATKDEQAETLAGLHADHLLIVADESSGIPDPTFIPLEGTMTQPDNKVILIGNMTKNSGYFYDTHFHVNISKDWCRLHWDSRKSSNVDSSYIDYMARKYGVDSSIFLVRVVGDPPLQDDTTLIPLWAAQQCIGKEIVVAEDEPLYLGVDVARYGDDSSIILPRQGLRIDPWETFNKLNTIDLGGFINHTYQELDAAGCAIDVIGVGAGVADWLQKHGVPNLHMVNVAWASSNKEKFDRLRDELWCKVRDNCLLGLYSFPDIKAAGEQESYGEKLANELSSVRYSFNKDGGFKIESKKDMKARGVASPNIADALCLTEYFARKSTRVFKKPGMFQQDKVQQFRDEFYSSQGWMA